MFAQTPERAVDPEKKSLLEERLLLAPPRESNRSLSIDKGELIAFINLIRSSSNGGVGIYRDILVTTVSEFIFPHACIFYIGGVFHVSLTLKPLKSSFNLCPALPFGTSSSSFADELDDVRSFLSKSKIDYIVYK